MLARGYFLAARETFRVLLDQGRGGSVVFVASKNALVAGANASAYSSAKAASLHLARCLAEEGGPHGIRVNTVNPDAVIQGSGIWSSDWKAERASTYGVSEDDLQTFYQGRTKLGVAVLPEDVAEVAFLAGPRAAKSTGNVINVDGVSAAQARGAAKEVADDEGLAPLAAPDARRASFPASKDGGDVRQVEDRCSVEWRARRPGTAASTAVVGASGAGGLEDGPDDLLHPEGHAEPAR